MSRVDPGAIWRQETIPTNEPSSVFELFAAQCGTAGHLLGPVVNDCLAGRRVGGVPEDLHASYRGREDTKGDISRLRARGHRSLQVTTLPILPSGPPGAAAALTRVES